MLWEGAKRTSSRALTTRSESQETTLESSRTCMSKGGVEDPETGHCAQVLDFVPAWRTAWRHGSRARKQWLQLVFTTTGMTLFISSEHVHRYPFWAWDPKKTKRYILFCRFKQGVTYRNCPAAYQFDIVLVLGPYSHLNVTRAKPLFCNRHARHGTLTQSLTKRRY